MSQLWEKIQNHCRSIGATVLYLGPGWAMTQPRQPKLEARLTEVFDQLPDDLSSAGLQRCECGAANHFKEAVGCVHCDRGRININGLLTLSLAKMALRCWFSEGEIKVMTLPHPSTGEREEFLWRLIGESEELLSLRKRVEIHFGSVANLKQYNELEELW